MRYSPVNPLQQDPRFGQTATNPALRRLFSLVSDDSDVNSADTPPPSVPAQQPYTPDSDVIGNARQQTPINQNLMAAAEPDSAGNGMPMSALFSNPTTAPDTAVASPATTQPQSKSDQLLQQIEAAKNAPAPREHSILKRLGSGLWNAFLDWGKQGAPGGLTGLVGAEATQGIGFTASPSYQGAYKKGQDLSRLWTQYGQASTVEKNQADTDLRKAQAGATAAKPGIDTANAETARLKVLADIEKERKADEMKGKIWEPRTNPDDGTMFKHFADGREEPLLDGAGKPRVDALKVPVYDENGNAMTGAQRGDQQTRREVGDANRAQQITIHNEEGARDIAKTNVSNSMKYNDDVRSYLTTIAQATANIASSSPKADAARQRMQLAAERMQEVSGLLQTQGEGTISASGVPHLENRKAFDAAQKEFNSANDSYMAEVGKVSGGQQLIQQLRQAIPKAPARLEYKSVAPTLLGRAKSQVSEQVFRQRLLVNGVTEPAQQRSLIAKAKQDGVIK